MQVRNIHTQHRLLSKDKRWQKHMQPAEEKHRSQKYG